MAISDPGRGLVRRLGVTAAALFAFAAASQQRAEALSLASPGAAPAAKYATDGLTTGALGLWRSRRRRWWFPGRRRRRLPRRRWRISRRWFSGRRVSWRWLQGRRCRVPWRRVPRRWRSDPSRRLSRRAGVPRRWLSRGAGLSSRRLPPRISARLSSAAFLSPPASLPSALLRAGLLRLSALLRIPASLLPRDLDPLRAAQDLQISSVAAPPLLRLPVLVRSG